VVAGAVAEGRIDIMPEVLVTGGGGALDGLAGTLMNLLRAGGANGNGSSDRGDRGSERPAQLADPG
jgi:hypothetical protein